MTIPSSISGKENKAPDALSRQFEQKEGEAKYGELLGLGVIVDHLVAQIKEEQHNLEDLVLIRDNMLKGTKKSGICVK